MKSSIMEKVEGNDELLTTILVRLPPKSIFKFKCVSKRWNSILNDPFFDQCYRERPCSGRLLALMQYRLWPLSNTNRLTILPIVQPNEPKIHQIPLDFTLLISSSGGLVLTSCIYFYHYRECIRYLVMNPLNKTFVELPRSSTLRLVGVGLFCDDNNTQELGPSFRIVGIASGYGIEEEKTMVIESYSSETKVWTMSKLVGSEDFPHRRILNKFVCNGVFHWHAKTHDILVYDSNRDEKCLQLMKLPPDAMHDCLFLTRTPSDEVVWVGTCFKENCGRATIKFWKLPKAGHASYKYPSTITEDQWVLMHTVDNDFLYKDMILLLESKERFKSVHDSDTHQGKKRKKYVSNTIAKAIINLKLEALIPSEPVTAVLSLRDKIFLYNLENMSVELIQCRGLPFPYTLGNSWHPLIESISLSTYAPFPNAFGILSK